MLKQTLTARAEATQLSLSGSSLPDTIQWMPPGRHTIYPSVNGEAKEVTINVTPELSAKFSRRLQQLRASAASGFGDTPYLDLNHDDAEASAEVTELFWGGYDPKKGGIRARITWSSAGQDALLGKTYRRFSPQWELDPETLEPVDIGPNLGGLVNRAAFRNIAPVMARASAARGIRREANDFIARARELADERKITLDRAFSQLSYEDPEFAQDYIESMSGKRPAAARAQQSGHPNQGIPSDDAVSLREKVSKYMSENRVTMQSAIHYLMHHDMEFAKAYQEMFTSKKG